MTPKSRRRRGPDQGHPDAAREQDNGSTVDLDALARRLAPLVALQLSAILAGAALGATYSTRVDGPVPPEFAGRRRAWLAIAPTIPGAVRLGRWWSIPRDAYERWLKAHAAAPQMGAPAAAAVEAEWSPAALAADLGLRLAGGRR